MDGTALVLSGGGAKGAYQIGVWKALTELDVIKDIKAISGTSIGAINAAFIIDDDYNEAVKLWSSLTTKKVLVPNLTDFLKCLLYSKEDLPFRKKLLLSWLVCFCNFGIFSMEKLEEIIDKYLDLEKISSSPIKFYATASEFPAIKPIYFQLNKEDPAVIKDMIMASAAIPIIFDDVDIEKKRYYDGGIVDNTPIKPLYDLGYRRFIVVSLGNHSSVKKGECDDCDLIEIIPSKRLGGFIKGTLNFSPEKSLQNIKLGYDDTMKLFQKYNLVDKVTIKQLKIMQVSI